jgi:hypothetical protein
MSSSVVAAGARAGPDMSTEDKEKGAAHQLPPKVPAAEPPLAAGTDISDAERTQFLNRRWRGRVRDTQLRTNYGRNRIVTK